MRPVDHASVIRLSSTIASVDDCNAYHNFRALKEVSLKTYNMAYCLEGIKKVPCLLITFVHRTDPRAALLLFTVVVVQ